MREFNRDHDLWTMITGIQEIGAVEVVVEVAATMDEVEGVVGEDSIMVIVEEVAAAAVEGEVVEVAGAVVAAAIDSPLSFPRALYDYRPKRCGE